MLILHGCLTGIRNSTIIAMIISLLVTGCKKSPEILPPGASLNIIAAIPDAGLLYGSFAGTEQLASYRSSSRLNYNSYNGTGLNTNLFNRPPGDQRLAFYRQGDTAHPEKPFIAVTIPLKASGIYSLFLVGTSSNPDTLLTTDHIPTYSLQDSVTGIRFMNLSPGSNPITINIAGMPPGSEVEELPYKSYTTFKAYPATANINDYTFEFRDKASGTLLATYKTSKMNKYVSTARITEVNTWLFRSSTFVFLGLPNGVGPQAQTVNIINHFTTR